MKKNKQILFLPVLALVAFLLKANGQPLVFQKLTAAEGLSNNQTIRTCIDKDGFLWIGTAEGLNRYDGKGIRQYNSSNTPLLRNNNIREVWCDEKNQIWLRTQTAILMLDTLRRAHEIIPVYEKPDYGIRNIIFTKTRGIVLVGIYFQYIMDENGKFIQSAFPWDSLIANRQFTDGAFMSGNEVAFSFSNEIIIVDYGDKKIIARVSLPGVVNIARINNNELLVMTGNSDRLYRFSVLQNKITEQFSGLTDQNGKKISDKLFYSEGLLDGRVGFTSLGSGIYIFNPATKELINYMHDPENPSSIANNEKTYLTADTSGYIFISSPRGLEYSNINALDKVTPVPFIYEIQRGDSLLNVMHTNTMEFRNSGNSFTFYFSPGSFINRNLTLEYKLNGADKNWKVARESFVQYSSLSPGTYSFQLRVQNSKGDWVYSKTDFKLTITQLWWKSWWFRLSALLLLMASGWLFFKSREKRIRKRSEEKLKEQQIISENLQQNLEMEKVISFFATSIGKKSSTEEILWDVAKNCISKLDFEDCVIYLLDEKGDHLVQKAAWGPKTTEENKILNPLIIPLGKGIVGHVAETGKPEIINDTSTDKRYIIDDMNRISEICVPLLIEGKVMGVIDSEHSQKNFFTPRHMQILTTVAALCANKIVLSRAEEEKKQAQLDLLELNQKMAEAKFMNLRLQMNPHFLFNSLSAIQHLIVSEQPRLAYKYLTVFSNLLRLVLQHADKNFITLDEEIKVVKMYLEIESLRFKDSFRYEIIMDESLDQEEILIPSLLLQPFVENAIWHGLLNKEGEKKLDIHFTNIGDTHLRCEITDNGVGRKKAAEIKNKQTSAESFESKALQIIHDRLKLLEQKTGRLATVEITDLYINDGPALAAGTKVVISIPFYFNADI